jgi:hypothetical protein
MARTMEFGRFIRCDIFGKTDVVEEELDLAIERIVGLV